MDTARHPATFLAATILTLVTAIGAALFGAFLVAIAGGAVPFYGNVGALSIVGIVGAVSLAFGAAALAATVGLWLRRSWARPLAGAIHVVTLTGVLVAGATGGGGPHVAAGVVLATAGITTILAPSTRDVLRV